MNRHLIVHHAILNVLEPILDRHFHPDSYACRTGKGTHAAADRLQRLILKFVGYRVWATHRKLRKAKVRHFRRRLRWLQRGYAAGRLGLGDIRPRLASWIGHARQTDSKHLLDRLSVDWVLRIPPPLIPP